MNTLKRGLKSPTDRRISKRLLPGFRIPERDFNGFSNLAIPADSSFYLVRIIDFARNEVWIADLTDRQKCFVSYSSDSDLRPF